MSARGLFGFFYKCKLYLIYNHFDSSLSGLGNNLLKEIKLRIRNDTLKEWKEILDTIKIVNNDILPTEKDVENLKFYTNLRVSRKSTDDWYCLTRECQGSYEKVLSSGYLYKRNLTNIAEDHFLMFDAEYIYILDFDKEKFFVYHNRNQMKEYSFICLQSLRS